MTTAGSQFRADGITDRPVYSFAPPAEFFAPGVPSGLIVFDIRAYGAVEGAEHNNQSAIQAAINAAHAAGGGVVYVPPGVWGIAASPDGYGSVHLLDNVFLKGAGMGESTLRLVDGSEGDITGLVRTRWGVETSNCGLGDLTLDGNQDNTTGAVDGFFTGPRPGSEMADSDIYVLRVEIQEVSRYAFDPHERTERLSIRDSVAHDNAVDGFVLDFITDSELSGNIAYNNGRHGFNFVTTSSDILLTDNVAHSNGGAGFVIQRGSENIESSRNITLIGGASYDNGREGVLVQMSENVVVEDMDIHGNGREGVRILGSSHVTVEGNAIRDNSQSAHDTYSEIEIQAYVDTAYDQTYVAEQNLISDNTISSTGAVRSRYGIEEVAGSTGGNLVTDNVLSGTVRGPYALNGVGSYALKLGTDAADTLVGSSSQDRLIGGEGDDTISGQDGHDLLEGGNGVDLLAGGKGNDVLLGGAGNDTLNGNSGNDQIAGGSGVDRLIGDAGNDVLDDGEGNDSVSAGSGDDRVLASAGDDVLDGGSGFDTLDYSGWAGPVSIDLTARTATGAGSDRLASFESVIGSAFNDVLKGDKNANRLDGGAGNDVLRGMGGVDTLTGGEGSDSFTWSAARDVIDSGVHLGVDRITDFTLGEDLLDLRGLFGASPAQLDDLVLFSDTEAGTVVSARIAGQMVALALLEDVHGLVLADLQASGSLLA